MKALSVFSGGLDSMLASEIIRGLGITVQALFFETPFFSAARALESARSINLPIKVIDITERHLEIVIKPKHGYGENMNPCIDCHALMLRKAGEMLEQERASFMITGEVLGQRPMSQNRKALSLVERESGYGGLILRPLSAKHLPSTQPEERGWVDRDSLMNFAGRSRKPQMDLAAKKHITEYPSPAGGCLLTDRNFSRRLKDLLSSDLLPDRRQIELLGLGRHFRIGPKTKIILGRNKSENDSMRRLADKKDTMLCASSVPGPDVLIVGEEIPGSEELAAVMTVSYSDAGDGKSEEVRLTAGGRTKVIRAAGRNKGEFRRYLI